jgi:hypothetical protein
LLGLRNRGVVLNGLIFLFCFGLELLFESCFESQLMFLVAVLLAVLRAGRYAGFGVQFVFRWVVLMIN